MSKIQCLTCGGMTEVGDALSGSCEYCGCRIEYKRIASFNAVEKVNLGRLRKLFESSVSTPGSSKNESEEKSNLAQALCYLLAGNFTLAKKKLASVIENDPASAEPYYYYALTLVNGRTLSELTMREARQITEYLQTAIAIDEDFVFPKLLYALVCLEYYEANELLPPDDGNEILDSIDSEVDSHELEFFQQAVNTDFFDDCE